MSLRAFRLENVVFLCLFKCIFYDCKYIFIYFVACVDAQMVCMQMCAFVSSLCFACALKEDLYNKCFTLKGLPANFL